MATKIFDYTRAEIIAGSFVLAGLALLAYLSISIGGFSLLPAERYQIDARFANVGDLKPGAPIKVAGVTIGEVRSIQLADYFGQVELAVDRKVALPKDTIASISTSGLLGDAYISLSPGASEKNLASGERITRTEPALNLADLLGRYAFGTGAEAGGADAPAAKPRATTPPAASEDKESSP